LVIIEDSNAGVTAAKRANMKCIWLSQPNVNYQCDARIDKLSDITDALIKDLLTPRHRGF